MIIPSSMQAGQQGPQSEQKTFEMKFRDAAFKSLRDKHPQLMSFIITFKIVDSDVSAGTAVGTFLFPFGKELLYLPVVLSEGSISSCEMLYNKAEESLVPITEYMVTSIANMANSGDPKVLRRVPFIEGTRTVVRNMFRPPVSTNPVLAGASSIDGIPDLHKGALSEFFLGNPEVLAKVAEFYPVEALAEKLRPSTKGLEKQAEQFVLPEVIKLAELTEQVAEALSPEERSDVLANGYTLRNSQYWDKEASFDVVSAAKLPMDMVLAFDVQPAHELHSKASKQAMVGSLLTVGDKGTIEQHPCLIGANVTLVRSGAGVASYPESCLVSGAREAEASDLMLAFGGSHASSWEPSDRLAELAVAYPTSGGAWGIKKISRRGRVLSVSREVGETFIYSDSKLVCSFVSDLDHGVIHVSSGAFAGSFVFPADSIVISVTDRFLSDTPIATLKQLQKAITGTAKRIRISTLGSVHTVTEGMHPSRNFYSPADTVHHLVTSYGLNKQAAEYSLGEKDVYLLKKAAAMPGQMPDPAPQQPQGIPQEMPQGMSMEQEMSPAMVNPEVLNQFLSLKDPEMLETGMLASLADSDSIKGMLVDFLPEFSSSCTALGKNILLFAHNEKDLVKDYGREQYSKLLGDMRRVFKTLGGLVIELRKLISMN